MDFIGKAYSQFSDLFRSMTPAARITTGLLLALVVISIVYLFRQQTTTADEFLFDAEIFTGHEIRRMEAAFSNQGLEVWDSTGNQIRVPRGQKSKYMAALAVAGAFPEHSGSHWKELFESDSPLDGRQQRDLKAKYARQRELEIAIREINGIENATVQITEIDEGGFPRKKEGWAAVTVSGTDSRHLNEDQIRAVRLLVASGGGVKPANVTVIDSVASISYPGTGKDGSPLTEEDAYAARQRQYESYYKRVVEGRLATYPGATVAVYVELDRNLVNRTLSEQYDAQPVALQTSNYTKSSVTANEPIAGRPGTISNEVLGNRPKQVSVASKDDTMDESREETSSVPSVTRTQTQEAGLIPKRVTASIGIPRSLFVRVWKTENPPTQGERSREPEKTELLEVEKQIITDIEDAIVALLPQVPPGEDPFPLVTVKPYTEAPLPIPESPSSAETAATWLGSNWQTVGMFALALFSMFFLRGMIRAPLSPEPTIPMQTQTASEPAAFSEQEDEEEGELENSLKARFQASGRSLRDELTELVREDPDAAANVLSSWIGDAA